MRIKYTKQGKYYKVTYKKAFIFTHTKETSTKKHDNGQTISFTYTKKSTK